MTKNNVFEGEQCIQELIEELIVMLIDLELIKF